MMHHAHEHHGHHGEHGHHHHHHHHGHGHDDHHHEKKTPDDDNVGHMAAHAPHGHGAKAHQHAGHLGTHGEFYRHHELPGHVPLEGYKGGVNMFLEHDNYEEDKRIHDASVFIAKELHLGDYAPGGELYEIPEDDEYGGPGLHHHHTGFSSALKMSRAETV